MNTRFAFKLVAAAAAAAFGPLAGCGGGGDNGGGAAQAVAPVTVDATGPDAVSRWNEIATNTINAPATPANISKTEHRPELAYDLAAVHIAIYDAVMAITATHKPYAVTPLADASGASVEAAVAAAAHGVLARLYPSRGPLYGDAYNAALAALPAGDATTKGLALGAEVARTLVDEVLGDEGRWVALAAYVPGTEPGQFRGTEPVNRQAPFMELYALTAAAQFRAPPPPALDSATYAADFNETRTLGGAASTVRTEAQLDAAHFHTEPPQTFWPRNLRRFATTHRSLAEHARLMAMLYTAQADATIACFESKYFYRTWRPINAIRLADTDGNPGTTAEPGWTPVVPTPNHPEYPAAHSCVAGAVGAVLEAYHGTSAIDVTFDSTATGGWVRYTSTQALLDDAQTGRIVGGMHFRFSTAAGATVGASVGRWIAANHFQPRAVGDPPVNPPRCNREPGLAARPADPQRALLAADPIDRCRSL